jgi:hypothetical protein
MFCNEFDALEGSQFSESGEASVTTNPGTQFFYAVWNQVDFGVDGLGEDSDAWFRRVLFLEGGIIDGLGTGTEPPPPPPPDPTPTPPPPENEAPVVSITSHGSGATFTEGDTITFSATADDPEDGDLSGVIEWFYDSASMGTGASIEMTLNEVGSHTITASVDDSEGLPGSASIDITVEAETPPPPPPADSLDVVVTASLEVAYKGDIVQIEAIVTDGTDPVEGASVSFLLDFLKTDITGSAVTDVDGVAVFSYKINPNRDGIGPVEVTATVNKEGYTEGLGTTTFEVQ